MFLLKILSKMIFGYWSMASFVSISFDYFYKDNYDPEHAFNNSMIMLLFALFESYFVRENILKESGSKLNINYKVKINKFLFPFSLFWLFLVMLIEAFTNNSEYSRLPDFLNYLGYALYFLMNIFIKYSEELHEAKLKSIK